MGTQAVAPGLEARKLPGWKRLFIKAAGFGTGFGLLVVFGMVGLWYEDTHPQPPKAWDKTSIQATLWNVSVEDDNEIAVRFDIRNTTKSDYKLEPGRATISAEVNDSNTLAPVGKFLASQQEAFIPAGRGTVVSLNTEVRYKGPEISSLPHEEKERKILDYLAKQYPELKGFVIFDNINRYEIDCATDWKKELEMSKSDSAHPQPSKQ